MTADPSPQAVLAELAAHARGDDLARLVHTVAFAAADERRASLSDGLAELAERANLTADDAETSYGNVLRALERGGADAAGTATRILLAAALARGVALSPPDAGEPGSTVRAAAESRVVEALVWLAANTSVDGLLALDAALGARADSLWAATAELVRDVDAGRTPLVGRPGALLAAAALRQSSSEAAAKESDRLLGEARDPVVRALLERTPSVERRDDEAAASASGELVAPPRSIAAAALLGVTGILAVMHVGRVFGRVALRYRRPAELRVSREGVVLLTKTELLGRTLQEREIRIPLDAVLRATREVKYPRISMYAGLFALAVGSYVGVSLFVDGARSGSPELVGIGLLVMAIGVALDFALESAKSSVRGRCRVVIVPRKGPAVAVGDIDPAVADAALGHLVSS